jgi:predicted nucleic acid-binding protein
LRVLVDTTVWIDFFADRPDPKVRTLEAFIEGGEDLYLCGVILAEVLQGIRSDVAYQRTRAYLGDLLVAPMHQGTFVYAADLYRQLRKKGITIRKSVDCMIAAVAIEQDLTLLHNDRDFDHIAQHAPLKVLGGDEQSPA